MMQLRNGFNHANAIDSRELILVFEEYFNVKSNLEGLGSY